MKRLSPEEQREARRVAAKQAVTRRAGKGISPAASRIRKEKAIESSLTRYLHLKCGHYGEKEAIFKPRNGLHWCDVEGIFSEVIPQVYRRELPEEPEF